MESADAALEFDRVSVAIVSICSAAHTERCLRAVLRQGGAPPFDVVVAYDPHIPEMAALAERFSDVRFVANAGQRTPLELASRALQAASGGLVLLTEDHCVPAPDWVREMVSSQRPGRAVVGGRVEIGAGASATATPTATDWAFYFVDFFLLVFTLGLYAAWHQCNVRRFRMENTRMGDTKFGFRGEGGELFRIMFVGGFLCYVTLGIYVPWYIANYQRFLAANTTLD